MSGLESYSVPMLLAINGFFTGFGGVGASLLGNFIWTEWVKPKLQVWHEKIKKENEKEKVL